MEQQQQQTLGSSPSPPPQLSGAGGLVVDDGSNSLVKARYRAVEFVGKGASGTVFRGTDMETGSTIAMKRVILRGEDDSGADLATTKDEQQQHEDEKKSRADIVKEAQHEVALGRRLDHKNVVRYLDDVEDEITGTLWIIMEFAERKSLQHVLKEAGPMSNEVQAAAVFRDLVAGLAYLHDTGRIIHRDIKAANVLITLDGTAKLSDFGLSSNQPKKEHRRKLSQHLRDEAELEASGRDLQPPAEDAALGTSSSTGLPAGFVGSVYWMAPEVIECTTAPTKASDIWALGATLVETLTGKPPYWEEGQGKNTTAFYIMFHIASKKESPISESLRARSSPELVDFLEQCFQEDPLKRPSASDLLKHPWISAKATAGGEGAVALLATNDSTDSLPQSGEASPEMNHGDGGQSDANRGEGKQHEARDDFSDPDGSGSLTGGDAAVPPRVPLSIQPAVTEHSADPLERSNNSMVIDPSPTHQQQQQVPFEKILEQQLTAPAAQREAWIVQQNGIERTVSVLSTAGQQQATTIVNLLCRFARNIINSQNQHHQQTRRNSITPNSNNNNNSITSNQSTNNNGGSTALATAAAAGHLPPVSGNTASNKQSQSSPLSAAGDAPHPSPSSTPSLVKTAFFDALGDTDLWMLELWETVNKEDLSKLFVYCCIEQEEGYCLNPAAGQGRIVSQMFRHSSKTRIATINALHKALTKSLESQAINSALEREIDQGEGSLIDHVPGGGDDGSSSLPTPPLGSRGKKRTRKTILDAMLEGGILQAIARVAEFPDIPSEELTPSNAQQLWYWINLSLEIVLHLTHGNDELFMQTLSPELQSTTLHSISNHCSFGAAMLVRWIRVNPADALEKLEGIAHLLGAATDQCLDYATRVEITKCFLVVQELPIGLSYLIAQPTIPMLGHVLGQQPPAGVSRDMLVPLFLELCQVDEFATACSQHSKFLRVLIEKVNSARLRSDDELADVLVLVKLLFMHALQPEVWFTCAELVSLVARTLQETHRSAAVLQEASVLLDGFSAQTKMI